MKIVKESTVKRVTYLLICLCAFGVLYGLTCLFPEKWSDIKATLAGWKSGVAGWVTPKITAAGEVMASPVTHTTQLVPINARDTNQLVYDTLRHYYPVLQGNTLEIAYSIRNKSSETLVISDIQTSCGCVVSRDALPLYILGGTTGFIHVDFNSEKNTGYVCHYIDCYGNFFNTDSVNIGSAGQPQWTKFIELRFDTNVVPPADYAHDYEEFWHSHSTLDGTIRDVVDGTSSQKNYWVDEDTKRE